MALRKEKTTKKFSLDDFTKRGFRRPRGAPFNVSRYAMFDQEYRRFLLSMNKIEVTFFNNKSFKILYNFDAERPEEDRLLINWDTLTPLFGGVTPSGVRSFVRLAKIATFVQKHIHLDQCEVGLHNSCFCGRTPPDDLDIFWDSCGDQHFHHFCSLHVRSWLWLYLHPKILSQESGPLFYNAVWNAHPSNLDVLQYYLMTGSNNTDILLDSARSLGHSSPSTKNRVKSLRMSF
ncbi:repeat element protein-c5.1 [Ichnoviriform fugitivi]|uniref:Repeat element protein-c5.1 n=1 Tax=Ichnoviriform fugitivi TaxID=265522 RepID=A2Q0G5_9VIRU|nr:repeat element protein-c5.1 [Ichnoviriform fugitivi]BAF45680.1 repeat element protein-c5.1 [Ichnoviriform fugitivi]